MPPAIRTAPQGRGIKVTAWAQVAPGAWSFLLDRLDLPSEKGDVVETWRQQKNTIQAAIGADGTIKQYRPAPSSLRGRWLEKVGWTDKPVERWAAAAKEIQYEAAGRTDRFDPKLRKPDSEEIISCDIDHIVELQFLGDNSIENLQVLDSSANQLAGTKLNGFLVATQRALKQATEDVVQAPVAVVMLQFEAIEQPGGALRGPGFQIEERARAGIVNRKNGERLAEDGKEAYNVVASHPATLVAEPKDPKGRTSTALRTSSFARNRAASLLIPGLRLQTLQRSPSGTMDEIDYTIDDEFEWPFKFENKAQNTNIHMLRVDPASNALSFKTPNPGFSILYPYLSKGVITELSYDPEKGLAGKGTLKPSIPILKRLNLTFTFTPDSFDIVAGLDEASLRKITPPFRGAKILAAQLSLKLWPEFRPEGIIKLIYAPVRDQRILSGTLTATRADDGSFALDGVLRAFIPGVDKAPEEESAAPAQDDGAAASEKKPAAVGTISYKNKRWSGAVTIDGKAIRLPFVDSGAVNVSLDDQGIKASGGLLFAVP